MKNKKAISDLIGWVLLIGFTITIAAFVTTWVIDQTKKFNPEDVAGGLKVYCEDAMLGIDTISGEVGGSSSCGNDEESIKLILTLKNKGKFTIWNIKILGNKVTGLSYEFGENGLIPSATSDVSFSFCATENNEIEIVPEIEVEGKKGYCSENTLVINDEILISALSAQPSS